MTRRPFAPLAVLGAGLVLCVVAGSCTETECATPDYTRAECRVVAENSFARLRTAEGVEVRFQALGPEGELPSDDRASWSAEGRVVERGPRVVARVAHPGAFALSLRNTTGEDVEVELDLDNIHPEAVVETNALVDELSREGLVRRMHVSVAARGVTWVRGGLPEDSVCAQAQRFVVLADVQENPTQFARIIERLQVEAGRAQEAGERLVAVIMPGDLTESASEEEFLAFTDLLEKAPVPFALMPGNHDVYDAHLPHYNNRFGPGNYAFDLCSVHVAVLDTGSGAIADSVLARLPTLLDKGDASHSWMAMHHPPHAATTAAGWNRENMAMMTLAEFAHQGGDLVLAGHAHMLRSLEFTAAGQPLQQIIAGTAGAWQGAGQPVYGYVRLRVDPDPEAPVEACFVEVPPPGGLPHVETADTGIPACPASDPSTK